MSDLKTLLQKARLDDIRNSNEARVVELLPHALAEYPGYVPTSLDIQDIFALTLNRLPPQYRQRETIQISNRLADEDVLWELGNAIQTVRDNPTRP
ncbi:Late competence development protein ComFB [Paucidesulfovibrio gracilis DSM 16080]|uniref:Late competence development protein ComFB n=1 Tax=Paucidesulfovibrio gracilis DSM 16080 TaxID=1121449 RepID=A0A1T4XFT4_9BACT|nr:late competence development ComFB family protein [Paucidesulfovibrio gracilis]SKA88353.1 Late competence development protein ComFB [Paucidesulfovibrio gracilis DSM 16080]